jgi:hypothetical protein
MEADHFEGNGRFFGFLALDLMLFFSKIVIWIYLSLIKQIINLWFRS